MLEALTGLTEVFLYYALARAQRKESLTMRTIIGVCLDESSSMLGEKAAAAVASFNEFLKTNQQATTDECLMSIVKFATKAWVLDKMQPVADIKPLDTLRYAPNGSTALNDAVLYVVNEIAQGKKDDDRVIICIITDGEENASESSLEQVKAKIQELEATGSWTFSYLAAGLNAFQQGAAYGIRGGNVAQMANSGIGLAASMGSYTSNMMRSRGTSARSFDDMGAGVSSAEAPDDSPAVIGGRPGPVPRAMTPVVPVDQQPGQHGDSDSKLKGPRAASVNRDMWK
jgi:uncharacterized protein YegL